MSMKLDSISIESEGAVQMCDSKRLLGLLKNLVVLHRTGDLARLDRKKRLMSVMPGSLNVK